MKFLAFLAAFLVGAIVQGAWDATHLCGPLTPLDEHLRIDSIGQQVTIAQGILNRDRARQERTYADVTRVLARRRR